MTTPYQEGFRARLRGDEINANPYILFSEEWQGWDAGWHEQDNHLSGRDEALESIGA